MRDKGTIWTDNSKVGYDYWVKHYEVGSKYGIEHNGRVSKLTIRKHGEKENLVNYDRGWDIPVPNNDEVRGVYAIILEKYN